ncbi:MAG: Phage-like element PBSX protein xkdA [Candidatus Carbobacillus altaicus]|uniref:Phage-like element PBSX protein xkdA n=1 Tax=Candidatus Carbonibacillus altaicus TaxID=2163959 RepID=A0A2R6Y096_9BACL|nr:MAG: Phage-like element PBSX protein xkdA [Candidatus Carbobacillus altaicus]
MIFSLLPVERRIYRHYARYGICDPEDIDINLIAETFGITIVITDAHSMLLDQTIVIDRRMTEDNQRESFFHELAHFILHTGNQLTLHPLFVSQQEVRANRLAMSLAAPSWMIFRLIEKDRPLFDQAPYLAGRFLLPLSFMLKRLYTLYRVYESIRTERRKS